MEYESFYVLTVAFPFQAIGALLIDNPVSKPVPLKLGHWVQVHTSSNGTETIIRTFPERKTVFQKI